MEDSILLSLWEIRRSKELGIIVAKNRKQKNIKVKTIGDNPNFTPKELEEKILEEFRNKKYYQIDNIGWLGMTAVYEHFEKIMMTLERNLRNAMAEKTRNEETLLEDLENISDKIIKQTYIIRKHKETNTRETNKI